MRQALRFVTAGLGLSLGACEMTSESAGPQFTIEPSPAPEVQSIPSGHIRIPNFTDDGYPLNRIDVEGASLDAHDGEIEYFDGLFHYYGASYGCGFQVTVSQTPFCGIKVYTSPDLVEWTDRGFLFDPSTSLWQQRCHGGRYGCFRPHVAFNPATGKYLLWINTYEVTGGFRVLESASPTGPFAEVPVPILAVNSERGVGHFNGDHNLFVDDDGTGYLAYTDWVVGGDLIIEELTPDFRSGTGRHLRLGFTATEAPAMFKRDGRYYLTFSDPNCGYCITGTSYITASHPLGDWSSRTRISGDSCGGQPAHVSVLPSTEADSVYLFQSDLWINFEFNQATARHFWSELRFTPDGEILPIRCDPEEAVPIDVGGTTAGSAFVGAFNRLHCELGKGSGQKQLEMRFVAPESGALDRVMVWAFRRYTAGGPLTVQILEGGRVIGETGAGHDLIDWQSQAVEMPIRGRVTAGQTYTMRFSYAGTAGCYGLAFYPVGSADFPIRSSADNGASWTPLDDRTLKFRLVVNQD